MSNTASNVCPAASDKPQPAAAKCHRLNSVKMFNGLREVIIEHAGDEYRLRLTSQGKLILTK